MKPGPRLKKRFGQHHLTRPELCRPLIEFLQPVGQRVLEVGPGGGVLTRELLAAGARVWGVERDLEWSFELRRRLRDPALQLLTEDALELPYQTLPAPTLVCGNLPYNVATPIVVAVLAAWERVPRAAFLVQLEVARRLAARPGSRDYGSLTVLCACFSEVEILSRLAPGAFRPPPRVESAFVGLRLHAPPLPPAEMVQLSALVRQGFSMKRKTLRNALAGAAGRLQADTWLAAAGIDGRARAEELPLATWLQLYAVAGDSFRGLIGKRS